jgi:hypothetical protein
LVLVALHHQMQEGPLETTRYFQQLHRRVAVAVEQEALLIAVEMEVLAEGPLTQKADFLFLVELETLQTHLQAKEITEEAMLGLMAVQT